MKKTTYLFRKRVHPDQKYHSPRKRMAVDRHLPTFDGSNVARSAPAACDGTGDGPMAGPTTGKAPAALVPAAGAGKNMSCWKQRASSFVAATAMRYVQRVAERHL